MTSFRQISLNEWQVGDYRPAAEIYRRSEELFTNYQVDFNEHYVEGLGRAKTAFFLTSNKTQFAVTEYLEPTVPITQILILNDPQTVVNDLNEVLEILGLSHSDLGFIYKY